MEGHPIELGPYLEAPARVGGGGGVGGQGGRVHRLAIPANSPGAHRWVGKMAILTYHVDAVIICPPAGLMKSWRRTHVDTDTLLSHPVCLPPRKEPDF
jgi:hypothetical protein